MLTWLVNAVLGFLWGKLSSFISNYIKQEQENKAVAEQAAQDSHAAENLTPNSTAKETDDAIDSELKHF